MILDPGLERAAASSLKSMVDERKADADALPELSYFDICGFGAQIDQAQYYMVNWLGLAVEAEGVWTFGQGVSVCMTMYRVIEKYEICTFRRIAMFLRSPLRTQVSPHR